MDGLCFDDLDLFGRELDDPVSELEQDVVHMVLEDPYSNPDALERSIGLEAALSGRADPSLRHQIESKLQQDDRINLARAVLSDAGNDAVRVDLTIEPNGETMGIAIEYDASGAVRRVT